MALMRPFAEATVANHRVPFTDRAIAFAAISDMWNTRPRQNNIRSVGDAYGSHALAVQELHKVYKRLTAERFLLWDEADGRTAPSAHDETVRVGPKISNLEAAILIRGADPSGLSARKKQPYWGELQGLAVSAHIAVNRIPADDRLLQPRVGAMLLVAHSRKPMPITASAGNPFIARIMPWRGLGFIASL